MTPLEGEREMGLERDTQSASNEPIMPYFLSWMAGERYTGIPSVCLKQFIILKLDLKIFPLLND